MFKISLFENAVDELKAAHMYIESFLDWRRDSEVPWIDLLFAFKQMVKHLCSGWELLMKYRLNRIDPMLVFTKPDEITEEKLKSGEFHTIGYTKAVALLQAEDIKCSFKNLEQLHKYRNKIEHYEIDVPFQSLIRTSLAAIDELIQFVACYVTPIIEQRGIMYEAGDVLIQLWSAKKKLESIL